ncbi:hypothetical protein OAP32_00680 [Crocinitomicaceae bacterium]|nr:hypothetical protein [Crocinitomicaceae bacterium]
MTTEAPEIGATEEVTQEVTDLQNTEVTAEAETEVAELDVDSMDDTAFNEFMNSQLEGNYEQTEITEEPEAAQSAEDADLEDGTAESEESELDDETVTEKDAESTGMSFNINGQEITVTDEADIKRLVERGLTSAVEAKQNLPAQQLAQMLANNKLDDPNKLNMLIDVANGDTAALRKLIKDNNIDPYDLASRDGDADETDEYKPKDHTVKAETLALNKVLDSLQDSEHFSTTADVVMEQWDKSSRQEFMDNPNNFTILNNQVADGTYEAISNEMQKLDIMGKLPAGRTQFELYRQVGDMMYANNLLPGQTPQEVKAEVVDNAEPSPEQRLQQAAQQKRKRAVAPSRSVPQTKTNQRATVPDAFSGSDAEFLKKTEHLFNSM